MSEAQILIVGFAVAGVSYVVALGIGYVQARRRMIWTERRLAAVRWPVPPIPPWVRPDGQG